MSALASVDIGKVFSLLQHLSQSSPSSAFTYHHNSLCFIINSAGWYQKTEGEMCEGCLWGTIFLSSSGLLFLQGALGFYWTLVMWCSSQAQAIRRAQIWILTSNFGKDAKLRVQKKGGNLQCLLFSAPQTRNDTPRQRHESLLVSVLLCNKPLQNTVA